MPRCKRTALIFMFAALWLLLPALPRAQVTEYQLKAVFLFNFVQFVEWPAESFAAGDSPIVVGVLGTDPFGALLDELENEAPVKGRSIVVRRFARVEEVDVCHLLFVNINDPERLQTVLAALKNRATLTVGDAAAFLDKGGMIQFVSQDERIRLRINLDAATAAGLTLSSKLLRPAQVITTAGG